MFLSYKMFYAFKIEQENRPNGTMFFKNNEKSAFFTQLYITIMSCAHQHNILNLHHWIQSSFPTLWTCVNSVWFDGDCTRKLNLYTHQILCKKIKIPTLKEQIPPVQTISRAKFGTFSSLLSFKKNCITVIFLRILILNHTFWSDKRVDKITK